MRQSAAELLLTAVLMVSDGFPGSQGTVVILPVQLHRAAANLDPASHNDSAGTRGVLTALQEEGLALCTRLDPSNFQPCLDLSAHSGQCVPQHLVQSTSYKHFNQSFPSDMFGFPPLPPTRIQSTVKHL